MSVGAIHTLQVKCYQLASLHTDLFTYYSYYKWMPNAWDIAFNVSVKHPKHCFTMSGHSFCYHPTLADLFLVQHFYSNSVKSKWWTSLPGSDICCNCWWGSPKIATNITIHGKDVHHLVFTVNCCFTIFSRPYFHMSTILLYKLHHCCSCHHS